MLGADTELNNLPEIANPRIIIPTAIGAVDTESGLHGGCGLALIHFLTSVLEGKCCCFVVLKIEVNFT